MLRGSWPRNAPAAWTGSAKTGDGRKTDPVDARSVALAALYAQADPGLRRVDVDDELVG